MSGVRLEDLPQVPYVSRRRTGWVAQFPLRYGERKRSFADSRYGGPADALSEAVRWLDRVLPPELRHNVERAGFHRFATLAVRSSTRDSRVPGRAGVRPILVLGQPDAWQAYIPKPAGTGTLLKTFSTTQYGENARRYALRQRIEWEQNLYGVRYPLSEDDWLRYMDLCREHQTSDPMAFARQGTITQPDDYTIQARINAMGRQQSRSFSLRRYCGIDAARVAAVLWLLDRAVAGPRARLQLAPTARSSSGTLGVRESVQRDRRGNQVMYVEATYKWNGRHLPKRFLVGRVGQIDPIEIDRAWRAARHFRQAYEAWVRREADFDPSAYRNWRNAF